MVAFSLPGQANAHPHVFAEAQLRITLSADQSSVTSLQHFWRFDEIFSSTVMMEFDKNLDLQLDPSEMKLVSETVYASLADYNYFQIVTVNGKDVLMNSPPSLTTTFENDQLTVSFESKPNKPLMLAGRIDFGVYDPTFYTAIDFLTDDNLVVDQLPAACTRTVIRPNADEAISQNQKTLTDAFFNDPTGTDMSKIFATKLELSCGAKG
ncbi:DUF1007 family protein [Mesorhizobium qingshengii]|uniref:DUF1007 family protein n=2 Tax=Mesorhizobium qingshengii TaxID=1165689 RepID=A0ABT4R2Q6_9HYPH|nr:DUF1007 family protein [Mesorhizobium qingshengii]MCZ8547899.1 DUF1007 family protein [Mesorhizobium qingshengii]